MEVLDAILTRRSIRKYSNQPVTDDQIKVLLESAMYAPSAVNKQPWHFIVFRDKSVIKAVTEKHPNASMLTDASAGILVCWDENLQHDKGYGPVDCSAATQNILLATHSMGIGSVWVGIYPREQRMEFISEIFKLPPNIKGFSIVSLGYPAETKMQPQRFNVHRIHYEKW